MNASELSAKVGMACDAFLKGARAEAYQTAKLILAESPDQQQARHIVLACEHGIQGPVFTCLVLREPALFEVGDFTYGIPSIVSCRHGRRLRIGRYCAFAMPSAIHLGALHRIDWASGYGLAAPEFGTLFGPPKGIRDWTRSDGDVVIGHDVWVATNATILSGSEIGNGAVISAEAVVSGKVEPYAIVAGNPGRVTGYRFSQEQIKALLEIAWWDWPLERVREHAALINSADLEGLARVASA